MARLRTWHVIPLAVLAVGAGLPAAAAAPAAAATATYTITDLGSLGGPVYPQTEPAAINASGQVTGYSFTSTAVAEPCPGHYKPPRTCHFYPQHAFLWSNGTMTDLGTLGGPDQGSSGSAINRSGEVAGTAGVTGTAKTNGTHAALWTGTTTVDLGALAPLSSGSWSVANGINDSGQVVGYWAASESTINTAAHPWLYSNGKMTSLPEPGGLTTPSCHADMINNSGQIIGNCSNAGSNLQAVLWQNGTVTTLGMLGGLQVTQLTGISNNGQIAGWGTTSTGATHGFLDSNGTVTDLGSFLPFALNDNGVMIGSDDTGAALIDSGGTVQNLQNLIPAKSGYELGGGVAINDNGQIVAETTTTETDPTTTGGHAVLLTPN
jgi:probable HAF family extracellular repeat protein